MKLSAGHRVVHLIKLAYEANRPVLLEGRHGIGKSEMFNSAAGDLGVDVIVRDLSLMEPVDLIGLPRIDEGVTTFVPPSFLPRAGKGLLVFEELNRAPRHVRVSCLELLTSRRLNDYELPSGWLPVAAINPASVEYVDTDELDVALLSRFMRIEVTASLEEWCRWARDQSVHEDIIQFVEQGSGALEPQAPSPRSWTYAGDLLKAWEAESVRDEEVLAAALAGFLDDEWALAFLQFYHHSAAPLNADQIIRTYPAHRPAVKRWVADTRLDLVAASLEGLKRHLQPQRHYDALIGLAQHKANVETFFGDLPPDLKRQIRSWLKDRDFGELSVPRKPRK